MKRAHGIVLLSVLTAVVLVAACDQHVPLTPNIGGGGGSSSGNKGAPAVSIDTLQPNPVNIGDSIYMVVHVRDDSSIASVTLLGLTVHGDVNLGTLSVSNRYNPISVGGFRAGLRDTVIRRYIHPATPIDTTLDSLVVVANATDNSGNIGSDTVIVRVVTGPKVSFITPLPTTQVFAGGDMGVTVHATHPDGVQSVTISVTSNTGTPTWPTPISKTVTGNFPAFPKDTTYSTTVTVPPTAPVGGRLTFTASGIDVNGKPGSIATLTLTVKGIDTVPPLVTQVLAPRIELNDSVQISTSGSSATVILGVIVKDSVGTEIRRDSVPSRDTLNNVTQNVHIPLTQAEQGRQLRISTFAIDRLGKTGYSVSSGTTVAQPVMSRAWSDTTVVVYGSTFPIPNTPAGTVMGDLAVDPVHGNVFVSNINYNRLEVWNGASKGFSPSVAVGSQPWGLAFGNSSDTLYVANSGGTNISRVFVGAGTMGEVLSQRILTRDTYIYEVTETIDPNTSRITLALSPVVSYSDRPQYLAISKAGRLYYSTKPTPANTAGTIRYLDPNPAYPAPDPRQIWQYASGTNTASTTFQLFNVDSVAVVKVTGNNPPSDTLIIWDHPYGQLSGTYEARDPDVLTAAGKLAALGSDIDAESGISIPSLALTDTTFVGISGDHTWIAFGEGNTGGAGRIMMVNDPSGSSPGFFSPAITVKDIIDNADEQVFGIAVDSIGATVASHGAESYFATVDNPFHLRLQGKYDSFDNGAGIAFDPGAYGINTPANDRIAFVGSQSGYIEIVDIAYYINRGKLTLKGNLYGPLRASRPFPGDPPSVIMKLFGLSSNGLVVIDLTAADIRPGP
jgi:hypothetical protein